MKRILLSLYIIMCATVVASASGPKMVDHSRAKRFLDFDVHALVGGSYVTENYKSCYPEISDINTGMGLAFGAGVGVRFNIRNFLGIGTELNFTRNAERMDMAVVGGNGQSVSNVFQRNTYYKFDVPVYVSFIFNLSEGVKWNVDCGMYYSYGTGGSQKNNIYDTRSNELGQLMMSVTNLKSDFYNDHSAFINSYRRGDIGLHIAMGLTFANHLKVGARAHVGMSNIANSIGIVKPSSHTVDVVGVVGWQF